MTIVDRAARKQAIDRLQAVADLYIDTFGSNKEGIEHMVEDLCRIVAQEKYPGEWVGLVQFIMKASG
jgi:hypothetical protein